jgi:hypothetical protein
LPPYLSLFLNSPAGLAQSEQFQTGSSGQLEIYPEHIQEFLIYIPCDSNGVIDMTWQKQLVDQIQVAASARDEARERLDKAKRMVEDALMGTWATSA